MIGELDSSEFMPLLMNVRKKTEKSVRMTAQEGI